MEKTYKDNVGVNAINDVCVLTSAVCIFHRWVDEKTSCNVAL